MKKQSKLEINISFLYCQNTYAEKKHSSTNWKSKMPKRRDLHLYEKKNYDQIKYSFEICFSILSSLVIMAKIVRAVW